MSNFLNELPEEVVATGTMTMFIRIAAQIKKGLEEYKPKTSPRANLAGMDSLA